MYDSGVDDVIKRAYKEQLPDDDWEKPAKPPFKNKPTPKPKLNGNKVAPIGGRKTRRRRRHKKHKNPKKNKKRSHRRKTKRKY